MKWNVSCVYAKNFKQFMFSHIEKSVLVYKPGITPKIFFRATADFEDVITANPKWPISVPLIICLIVPPHNCCWLEKSKYQVVVREVDGVR